MQLSAKKHKITGKAVARANVVVNSRSMNVDNFVDTLGAAVLASPHSSPNLKRRLRRRSSCCTELQQLLLTRWLACSGAGGGGPGHQSEAPRHR